MADLAEIAVASWRLEKWVDNVNVERKMAAKSSLRAMKKYLQENNIEVVDLTGEKFDAGLAVTVVNNESEETDEEKLLISEMVKPIIKENGAVIQFGQVILGDEIKKPKENKPVSGDKVGPPKPVVPIEDDKGKPPEQDNSNESSNNKPKEDNKPAQKQNDNSTVSGEQDEKVQKNEKPYFKAICGCLMALQIVAVILIIVLFGKIEKTAQNSNSVIEEGIEKIDTIEIPKTDISGLEARLGALEEEYASLVSELKELGLSTDEILNYIEALKAQESESGTEPEKPENIEYYVRPGDTLVSICVANGIDYSKKAAEILKINNITNPDMIIVGQKIILPVD